MPCVFSVSDGDKRGPMASGETLTKLKLHGLQLNMAILTLALELCFKSADLEIFFLSELAKGIPELNRSGILPLQFSHF